MIRTTVEKEGFSGILMPYEDKKDKVMIVITGSNGGIRLAKQCAAFYSRYKMPALAVALFGTKGTPEALDRIPLEYIENAIEWLRKLGYRKIGIDGISKGSELALLSASMFSELSCVIARAPSYYVSEGLVSSGKSRQPSGTSCWSYRGNEIPFARYNYRNFNIPGMILREKEFRLIAINEEKNIKDEDLIPVENIKGPLLLLSGRNDVIWPSYENGLFLERRLNEFSFSYPMRHIVFQYLGHEILIQSSLFYQLAFKDERRYPAECRTERQKLAYELLNWVRNIWK